MCPVCTIGVAAGLGLSRYLGVDDLISGLWIGAILLSLTFLTRNWLIKKKIIVKKRLFALILMVIWILTFVPLKYLNIINEDCPTILGINKLIFGSFVGILAMSLGAFAEQYLRSKNNGKANFPYQKVIIPIGVLIFTSLILYLFC